MKKFLIQLLLFFIASLNNLVFCQQIPVLNLSQAIEHPVNISLRDFVESITYIPLATTYDYLVDKNPKVYVTRDYIVIVTLNRCQLFSRKDGSFIREIGKYGRGPGEFRGASMGLVNDHLPACYFMGWTGNLIKYTMDGVFRGNIIIPGFKDSFDADSSLPLNYSFLNDSIISCDFLIGTGMESKSLMLFNEKGGVIKIIPNRNILKTKKPFSLHTNETSFYHFDKNLYFQSRYNDTVFRITVDKITPHFILDRGKHSPPFESKWWDYGKIMQSNLIYQPQYSESKRFISFNFYLNKVRYFASYDKSKKILSVADNSSGIKNNLDGFIDLSFDSMNSDGELIGIIQANDLAKWIEKNPEKFNELSAGLQKLKKVQMEDNPVIVVGKYKQ
jgi:hypothetical protein